MGVRQCLLSKVARLNLILKNQIMVMIFLSIAWNRITLGGPAHEIPTRTLSNPGFDQGGPASEAGSCQHSGVESHK